MTELSGRADLVALVQTALLLPYMLFSMVAGAISDTYDRRLVSLTMRGFALASALLLLLCFLSGTANAVFGPAWQALSASRCPPRISARPWRSIRLATTLLAASVRRSAD